MTNGELETVVSASLQKIKLIKNPIKHFYFFISLNLKLVTHLSIISMVILHTSKPWTLTFGMACWGGIMHPDKTKIDSTRASRRQVGHGAGQNIATHASPTTRDFFVLISTFQVSSPLKIVPNGLPA